MSFRLFGVNVQIQPFFWLTTALLAMPYLQHGLWQQLIIWTAVLLVSVLVHEFGHAFAVKRHRIEPEIALHGMGGTTSWRALLPIGRVDHIIISVAGPFAGFLFGGLIYGFARLAPAAVHQLGPLGRFAIDQLLWVNVAWGLVNLIPVLPLDGGHVLEHALGPRRIRLTAAISFLVGMGVAAGFIYLSMYWGALIFGFSAMQSYQRFRAEEPAVGRPEGGRKEPPPREDPLPPELSALLQSARHALTEEQFERAIALAQQVLEGPEGFTPLPPRAEREALETIAWAHLLTGRIEAARDALARARKLGEADAALIGAVLLAQRDLNAARKALEEARARGDDRKEVVGPLIQILIEQGEVARAAAVAFDIVESLSADDARKMAQLAFEHRAYDWSARLFASVFDREKEANDAYDAARALALEGNHERALEWLRKAVEAGFSDRARAWSDAALEALRASRGLETVLPRP